MSRIHVSSSVERTNGGKGGKGVQRGEGEETNLRSGESIGGRSSVRFEILIIILSDASRG